MNDNIIRMARSAIRLAAKDTDLTNFDQEATILDRYQFLYWFAKEVAAAEREAVIRAAIDQGFVGQAYADDFAAAIRSRT